jgi:hypothetical protein
MALHTESQFSQSGFVSLAHCSGVGLVPDALLAVLGEEPLTISLVSLSKDCVPPIVAGLDLCPMPVRSMGSCDAIGSWPNHTLQGR